MPQVQVNLYATLRKYVDGAASLEVEITPGQTIEKLLHDLGVPPQQTRIIFVNSRSADLSATLNGDEQIGIFPAIGGG